MPSARIYRFPLSARRRPVPPLSSTAAPVRYIIRRTSTATGGFTLLFLLTLPAAFLYLSGVAGLSRHDACYAALLAAVWGGYFLHERLLRSRLGPLLTWAGRLLLLALTAGCFGGLYWLVLSHP